MDKKNIVLAVSGSISAYKSADIANILTKKGFNVNVIISKSALNFITISTLQTLSKNKVVTDVFDDYNPEEVTHIALAKKADLFLIAPASANIIGKVANGIADDMVSTTVLATKAPVYIAPAMNTNMYENLIVQDNIAKLKRFGYNFIEPGSGLLACGDTGIGKLASVEDIIKVVESVLK